MQLAAALHDTPLHEGAGRAGWSDDVLDRPPLAIPVLGQRLVSLVASTGCPDRETSLGRRARNPCQLAAQHAGRIRCRLNLPHGLGPAAALAAPAGQISRPAAATIMITRRTPVPLCAEHQPRLAGPCPFCEAQPGLARMRAASWRHELRKGALQVQLRRAAGPGSHATPRSCGP